MLTDKAINIMINLSDRRNRVRTVSQFCSMYHLNDRLTVLIAESNRARCRIAAENIIILLSVPVLLILVCVLPTV